jgi:hypothetical protein
LGGQLEAALPAILETESSSSILRASAACAISRSNFDCKFIHICGDVPKYRAKPSAVSAEIDRRSFNLGQPVPGDAQRQCHRVRAETSIFQNGPQDFTGVNWFKPALFLDHSH